MEPSAPRSSRRLLGFALIFLHFHFFCRTAEAQPLEPDPIPLQATEAGGLATKWVNPDYTLLDAVRSGSLQAVRQFLDAKADVTMVDSRGYTALMIACEKGMFLSAQDLLTVADSPVNHRSPTNGATALSLAVVGNHKEIVSELLRLGADPNTVNKMGISVLAVAAQINFYEVVRMLLAHGADASQTTPRGDTPLLMASTGGHVSVVEMLLNAGADIRESTPMGYTALMLSASRGHVGVVELLLRHPDIDPNRRDDLHMSALDHAEYHRRADVVRLLLMAGVDIGPRGINMDAETSRLWNEAQTRRYAPETSVVADNDIRKSL